jgi:HK97 gp10 family phage protein
MINLKIKNQRQFEKELEKFYRKNRKEFEFQVEHHAGLMERMAKKKAPKGEGKLRDEIHQDIQAHHRGEIIQSVISEMNYSAPVEYGSRPHRIRIKNKKVLATDPRKVSGNYPISKDPAGDKYAILGKEVNHPGTEPRPFMTPAFHYARKKLVEALKEVFK